MANIGVLFNEIALLFFVIKGEEVEPTDHGNPITAVMLIVTIASFLMIVVFGCMNSVGSVNKFFSFFSDTPEDNDIEPRKSRRSKDNDNQDR